MSSVTKMVDFYNVSSTKTHKYCLDNNRYLHLLSSVPATRSAHHKLLTLITSLNKFSCHIHVIFQRKLQNVKQTDFAAAGPEWLCIRLVTAEARVRSQACTGGMFGGRGGIGTDLHLSTSVLYRHYHPSKNPYSSPTLYGQPPDLQGFESRGSIQNGIHEHAITEKYVRLWHIYNSDNSVALVRKRTIPTEWPPPVGEVSANFCG